MADAFEKQLLKFLEHGQWLSELQTDIAYERLHDDHDGTKIGKIIVYFGKDGDAWIRTDTHEGPTLRFRAPLGGGYSPRTRSALMILALAIYLDNEDRPT